MGPIAGLLILAAIVAVAAWLRPKYRPLHVAFTATAASILFLVAGTFGYTIKKNNWSFISGTWSEGVVWWEIVYGLVAMIFAIYFWRKGLQRAV